MTNQRYFRRIASRVQLFRSHHHKEPTDLSIHILAIALLSLAVALVLAVRVGLPGDPKPGTSR